ncbi:hypothetical protein KY289_013375 [Solanum tuberosum]|nr:hypothetical protein KY289_013375 [Solanum tuberosum]
MIRRLSRATTLKQALHEKQSVTLYTIKCNKKKEKRRSPPHLRVTDLVLQDTMMMMQEIVESATSPRHRLGSAKQISPKDIMFGTNRRAGTTVASSNRKRVRTGTTIPPAPAVPRGQTQHYGINAIAFEGKKWDFPQIMRHLEELHMRFIFQDPMECNSTTKWIRHEHCGYHQTYPYAHINQEARAWLKIVKNCLIPGLHFTEVTQDRVCLVHALMKDVPINVGAVLKSTMRKARVHNGRRYAFGGLITSLCRTEGVPEESVDYIAPLFTTPLDVTKTKGPKNAHGATLTTTERNKRDDLIMAHMYGLEMLRHKNGCQAFAEEQLSDIEQRYPLNEHAKVVLGLGPEILEPIWDDVPTDKDKMRTMSDIESNFEKEEAELLALAGIIGDDGMDE